MSFPSFEAAKATYLQTQSQSDYDKMKSLANTGNSQVLLVRELEECFCQADAL